MAEDQWSAAGFKPVRAPAAPRRGPTRSEVNRAQLRGTEASITNAYVNAAQGQAALEKAPIDKANAASDLNVARATEDARIRKELASADVVEQQAVAARLKAKYPDLTEQQSLAAARYILMDEGEKLYQTALKSGYEPTSGGNRIASVAKNLPFVGNEDLADLIRDPISERAAAGERLFTAGALRQETGAGGPKEERPGITRQYYPTAWQSKNPRFRKELEAVRRRQIATMRTVAGPAVAGGGVSAEVPKGMTPQAVLQQAKAAIAAGKDRAGVIAKVRAMGIDPKGL